MEYRNKVISMMAKLDMRARMSLLCDNQFQAGLNALDPDCPCYMQDEAIQGIIFYGLVYKINLQIEA
jgi:hypothetical protein